MSASIPARRRGIAILVGVVCGVASVAHAESSALAPIDPFCHLGGFGECVMMEIDPGIYLPETEPDPWTATLEVGYSQQLVCSFAPAPPQAPGCIDINDLTRIVPQIDLPDDLR
jgi:hypothetical protein